MNKTETKNRKCFSLQEKLNILKEVDEGRLKKTAIAAKHGIAASTLSTFVKDRSKIEQTRKTGDISDARKRIRRAKYEDVEAALFLWFKDVRAKNVPVSGPLLQEKANSLAFLLGVENFNACPSWVTRFRQRHGIVSRVISGEAGSVNETLVESWLKDNLEEVKNYAPKDVFNADESGFFFKVLPNRSLTLKGEKCHGGKKSKERVTVLFCCNMDGSEKIELLVIGKSKRPRCFKGVRSLPVTYVNTAKAWMNTKLFQDWLTSFDRKMVKEKRKVLLLVDNVGSHVESPRLEAVKLMFLAPNTTSHLQPLDQGIIAAVKANYRKRLVKRILLNMDLKRETAIDLKMAIDMLYGAWGQLTSETIQKCFKKAGFSFKETVEENEDQTNDDDQTDDAEFQNEWQIVAPGIDFQEYVAVDEHVVSSVEFNEQDIIRALQGEPEEASSDDELDVGLPDPPKIVSTAVATDSFNTLRAFVESKENLPENVVKSLSVLEDFVVKVSLQRKKQSTIPSFFLAKSNDKA